MSASLPTGRSGQVIAVLLVLLVVAIAWRVVVAPLCALYQDRDDQLAHQSAMAARLDGLAAQLPQLKARAGSAAPVRAVTFEGASDAITAANLQGAIQDMVSGAGVTLGSVEILPAEQAGDLRRIGIKLSVSGGFPAITRLIEAVEGAEPPMVVDDVQIHASLMPGQGEQARVDSSFAVYAFRAGAADGRKP